MNIYYFSFEQVLKVFDYYHYNFGLDSTVLSNIKARRRSIPKKYIWYIINYFKFSDDDFNSLKKELDLRYFNSLIKDFQFDDVFQFADSFLFACLSYNFRFSLGDIIDREV